MIDFDKIEQIRKEHRLSFDWPAFLPLVLPPGWKLLSGGTADDDGVSYFHAGLRFTVILSAAFETDGKRWLHLSLAHPDRDPPWNWIVDAKELLLGKDRQAIMILPARERWVNIHAHAFHLWSCLDNDGLPDFSSGTGSI